MIEDHRPGGATSSDMHLGEHLAEPGRSGAPLPVSAPAGIEKLQSRETPAVHRGERPRALPDYPDGLNIVTAPRVFTL